MVLGFGNINETPTWMRILFVGIVAIIIILVVLTLAGVDMSNLGIDLISQKPPTTELVFWKRYDPLIPLRVDKSQVGGADVFDRYTMMIDMIWINTRVTTATDIYRHILHRGSGEAADYLQDIQLMDITSAASNATTPTRSEVLKRMPQGMPVRMNPGVMADPVTNDMIIFVDTERDNQNYRESIRIPDIPMDQPFKLSLIVMPTLIEVYINCRLEATKLIDGIPKNVESNWYGLVGPSPLNAAIQNLRIINRTLGSKEISSYCKWKPEFPEAIMRQCNSNTIPN